MDGEEATGGVIGYMCGTDFDCELGEASDGCRVFPSIEELKAHAPCWSECGIVEVVISPKRVVQEPSRFEGDSISQGPAVIPAKARVVEVGPLKLSNLEY